MAEASAEKPENTEPTEKERVPSVPEREQLASTPKPLPKGKAKELSVYITREVGESSQITLETVTRTAAYRPGTRACMLCLTEKYTILQARLTTLLNRRTELMGICRHINKFN